MKKKSLIGLTYQEIQDELRNVGTLEKHVSMRAKQIYFWIYCRGSLSFDDMTNLSREYRILLSNHFSLQRPECVKRLISCDGTRKYIMKFHDGVVCETVLIPDVVHEKSHSVCVSSQVGCSLNCLFCYTGTQKIVRNLSSSEIVSQIMYVKDDIGDWKENPYIRNIVFMGMGEPLMNTDNVVQSVSIMTDSKGLAISRQSITVSTSGIIDKFSQLGKNARVPLAVSLHAPYHDLRTRIMPINKKYPLKSLIEECRLYLRYSQTKKITFEYVMLQDINDSLECARKLVSIIHSIPSKVNFIPFNTFPNCIFQPSSSKKIHEFTTYLRQNKCACFVRKTRGADIMAACGQLWSTSTRIGTKNTF